MIDVPARPFPYPLSPDGHTASLFPGTPAPLERFQAVTWCDPVAANPSVKPAVERVTITAPVIWRATNVFVLAEGSANWWDAFQLVPVTRGFWHDGQWLDVFPVRHHQPESAFGLRLPGSVVWTGDTRPIPEMLAKFAAAGELIAHDCALQGNPSHSGIDDLEREYSSELLARCLLYHYASAADADALRARGRRVAVAGELVTLADPTGPVVAS